jgi:hypothetical protein
MERTLACLCQPSNTTLRSVANFVLDIFGDFIAIGREHVKKARSGQSDSAAIPPKLQDVAGGVEQISLQQPPHASIQNLPTPPPTFLYRGNPSSEGATPQPIPVIEDPMTSNSQPDFLGYFPFNFPSDITDPDPAFMFAQDWDQLDLSGVMGHDEEFVDTDNLSP